MLTFHWEGETMLCSFCRRPAMQCNVWAKEPCVERAFYDVVQTAGSAVDTNQEQ